MYIVLTQPGGRGSGHSYKLFCGEGGGGSIKAKNLRMCYAELFLHRTRKLPCIFAALFVCYSHKSDKTYKLSAKPGEEV